MKPITHKKSIITRISIALAGIVLLGMSTMLISYWLSERAENDSLAINIAGSLRVQTYRLGLLSADQTTDRASWQNARAKLEETWAHPVFIPFLHSTPKISGLYQEAKSNWELTVIPLLDQLSANKNLGNHADLQLTLDNQIALLDKLVTSIQQDAERKVRSFRLVSNHCSFCDFVSFSDGYVFIKNKSRTATQPINCPCQTYRTRRFEP